MANSNNKLQLTLIDPFTTFVDGEPKPIPYVIAGLLTQGGFSILAAKPKHGKSSMSRVQAVAVSKGLPFLDRKTEQGEVLLISLEDQLNVVDNSLKIMGWNPSEDANIQIVEKFPETMGKGEHRLDCIVEAL